MSKDFPVELLHFKDKVKILKVPRKKKIKYFTRAKKLNIRLCKINMQIKIPME